MEFLIQQEGHGGSIFIILSIVIPTTLLTVTWIIPRIREHRQKPDKGIGAAIKKHQSKKK
jgi:hypothetical protein